MVLLVWDWQDLFETTRIQSVRGRSIYYIEAAFYGSHYGGDELLGCILDPTKGLPCTCAFSMGLTIVTFIPSMFTKSRKYIHFFTGYSGRYVYNNNKDDTEYNRMCSENIDQSIRRFFIKISMVVSFTAVAQIGPAYAYMKSGTRTTASEMKFPFVDAGSDLEFCGNLILQGLAGCFGTTAYVAIEVCMGIAHDLVCIFPKLMEYDLKELKTMIGGEIKPRTEVYSTFKNIMKDALIGDDMISSFKELVFLRCLIAPVALTYSIGMSIFCQYQLNYAAGYGLALISFVQMFYLCELSQQLEDSEFAQILYDFELYRMMNDKKLIQNFMILSKRKQNPATLTFGPFCSMNREFFRMITRKVYSFVMFLLKVYK